jgi:hypothetical protein
MPFLFVQSLTIYQLNDFGLKKSPQQNIFQTKLSGTYLNMTQSRRAHFERKKKTSDFFRKILNNSSKFVGITV